MVYRSFSSKYTEAMISWARGTRLEAMTNIEVGEGEEEENENFEEEKKRGRRGISEADRK